MVGPFGTTVTVINKSGKVVSTSKHLVSVFKEAKAAYISRKAEIHAGRDNELSERQARHALRQASISDEYLPRRVEGSVSNVRRSKTTTKQRHSHQLDASRRPLERGYTDSAFANDSVYARPSAHDHLSVPSGALVRRNTSPPRRSSSSSFDEHLAYGELPAPVPTRRMDDEIEIRGKMSKLTQLLDEANCLQYSASAMIEHLQKNPDALASVALTLAEVSATVGRLAPSALAGMRATFPAAMALLVSPQFLIAAGLGVGVTVVMLGGYKIIKRIREKKDLDREDDTTRLREIEGELPQIELWRRGIADLEAQSVGTTVEGELITPHAANQLIEQGRLAPERVSRRHTTMDDNGRSKNERSEHGGRPRGRRSDSVRSEGSKATSRRSQSEGKKHHHHHHSSSRRGEDDDRSSKTGSAKEGKRRRAVSGLKMLFQGRTMPAS